MTDSTETATTRDVVLDLVQILDEAADSGRLVGGESITIEEVSTARSPLASRSGIEDIVLVLSSGERVEIRVDLIERSEA